MPFNLKRFLKQINKQSVASKSVPEPAPEPESAPIPESQPIQEIEIPVYVPQYEEDDSGPETAPIQRKRKNTEISRKVALNPLGDE